MADDRLTYVYCLARARRAPSLKAPRGAGLPAAGKPRLLAADSGLWLVAATVPAERYGEAALEAGLRDLDWVSRCAVGHERVVEAVTGVDAVVPMKLFTIYLDDERALAHVRKQRSRLTRVLDRVSGCAEWGLRVTLDEVVRAPTTTRVNSGTDFLRAKKQARDSVVDQARRSQRDAEAVHKDLAGRANAAKKKAPGVEGVAATRLILDAAYLVPAREGTRFRAAVSRAARSLAKHGCTVNVSGPWPPYHFVGDA